MAEPRRFTVTCATCEGPIDFGEDGVSPRCAGCHQSGDGCTCKVAPELDWLSGALLAVQGSVERGRYRPRGVWVQQARKILTWLNGHGWQLIRPAALRGQARHLDGLSGGDERTRAFRRGYAQALDDVADGRVRLYGVAPTSVGGTDG